MSKRTISVIVTAYNQAEKLENCLDSILAASLPTGWRRELIVVDNNSTDQTAEVVEQVRRRAPREVSYLTERRQGKCFALNTGVRAARGEIIAFTDQDCLASPVWLLGMVDEFAQDPELGGVGGRVVLFNHEDAQTTTRTSVERRELALADILPRNIPIVGCNFAVRRSVLERIGLFDTIFGPGTALPAAEDLDYLHRMTALRARLVYAPDLLIHHDHGRSNKASVQKLNRAYAISRGGYYAKFALKGDRHAIRAAIDECRPLLSRVVRGPFDESTAAVRRHLGALVTGMYRYLIGRLWRRGGEETITVDAAEPVMAQPRET